MKNLYDYNSIDEIKIMNILEDMIFKFELEEENEETLEDYFSEQNYYLPMLKHYSYNRLIRINHYLDEEKLNDNSKVIRLFGSDYFLDLIFDYENNLMYFERYNYKTHKTDTISKRVMFNCLDSLKRLFELEFCIINRCKGE